jgi:hypothetical protein
MGGQGLCFKTKHTENIDKSENVIEKEKEKGPRCEKNTHKPELPLISECA